MDKLGRGRAARGAAVLIAATAVLVAAATAAAAPARQHAAKDNTIVVGVPGIPPVFLGVMPYVAQLQGYYKHYGVAVTIKQFATGTDAVRAVQAGQIDLAWAPTPFALVLMSKGVPLVGIEGMDKVDWLIGSNSSSVKACSDLKGQNIGVDSIGGARYQALQAMLTKCKLTVSDVHPVVLPGNTAIQALLAGQIHVSVLHLDDLAEADAQGASVHKVITIAQTDPFQHYDMLVTTKSNLQAKRALLVNFLKADIQAIRFMNLPKALDHVAQIATVTGHSAAVAKTALQEYLALNWWPLNRSGLGIGQFKRTVYENVLLGNINPGAPPTWQDSTDTSLWKQAFKAVPSLKTGKK